MQFRVGAVDGKTYESVVITDEELQAELDKVDGKIGSGYLEGIVIHNPDEFVDFMREFLKGDIEGVKPEQLTMNMESGQRVFPMDQIVWWEIDR